MSLHIHPPSLFIRPVYLLLTIPYLSSTTDPHQVPKLFAYGNTTVLCWGRVHPDPAFYNALHVFPIGQYYLH